MPEYVNASSTAASECPCKPPLPPVAASDPLIYIKVLKNLCNVDNHQAACHEFQSLFLGKEQEFHLVHAPNMFQQLIQLYIQHPESESIRNAIEMYYHAMEQMQSDYNGLLLLQEKGILNKVDEQLVECPWPSTYEIPSTVIPNLVLLLDHINKTRMNVEHDGVFKTQFVTLGLIFCDIQQYLVYHSTLKTRKFNFIHLGSGAGEIIKVVSKVLCSPTFSVARGFISHLFGIEKVKSLHIKAEKEVHDTSIPHSIQFALGDISSESGASLVSKGEEESFQWWNSPGIILVNATSFNTDLMNKLRELAIHLPVGSFVISISRPLPNAGVATMDQSKWRLRNATQYPMPWGIGTCYIHERIDLSV